MKSDKNCFLNLELERTLTDLNKYQQNDVV